MTIEKALELLESTDNAVLFKANGLNPVIEQIQNETKKASIDISTKKNRDYISSMAFSIGKAKNAVDKKGKDFVAVIKAQSKANELRQQADAKRIADAEAATKKAELEKEQAIEKERQRVADVKKAEDDAQAKREANKKHVAKILVESTLALKKLLEQLPDHQAGILAKDIVMAIAEGKIPNISVKY